MVNDVSVIENFSTSDHKMVQFRINGKFNKYKKKVIYIRDFKDSHFSKLNRIISERRIEVAISTKYTVEQKYNEFLNQILEAYNEIIPNKSLNTIIKQSYPSKIRDLFSEKLRLHRLIKKDFGNRQLIVKYKIVSCELKKQLNKFRDEREQKLITSGQNSVNRFIYSE